MEIGNNKLVQIIFLNFLRKFYESTFKSKAKKKNQDQDQYNISLEFKNGILSTDR